MDIQEIISKSSDKAIQDMINDFKNNKTTNTKMFENLKSTDPEIAELSSDYKLMMKYCNYLVGHALEEYSKESK